MIELEIDLGLFSKKTLQKLSLQKNAFSDCRKIYYIPMPFNIFEVLTRGSASKRLM